jgi:hypothetical protein
MLYHAYAAQLNTILEKQLWSNPFARHATEILCMNSHIAKASTFKIWRRFWHFGRLSAVTKQLFSCYVTSSMFSRLMYLLIASCIEAERNHCPSFKRAVLSRSTGFACLSF